MAVVVTEAIFLVTSVDSPEPEGEIGKVLLKLGDVNALKTDFDDNDEAVVDTLSDFLDENVKVEAFVDVVLLRGATAAAGATAT